MKTRQFWLASFALVLVLLAPSGVSTAVESETQHTRLEAPLRSDPTSTSISRTPQWTRLTTDPADDLDPVWSPDGNKVLWAHGYPRVLWIMNADGTNKRQLGPTWSEYGDWSPDGSKIVFGHYISDSNYTLQVMNADGTGLHDLVSGGFNAHPRWSPLGDKIVYVHGNGPYCTPCYLYIVNADGTNPHQVGPNPIAAQYPSWSPDGTRIAFVSSTVLPGGVHTNVDIYVVNADGTGLAPLNTEATTESNPVWSPDGSRILFRSDRAGGDWDFFIMNADGTNVQPLFDTAGEEDTPDWSHDGTRIIFQARVDGNADIYSMDVPEVAAVPPQLPGERITFASRRDGNWEIYLMAADGSGARRLTHDLASDSHPDWSPDTKRIAFSSDRDGYYEIYIVNPDGSGLARATTNPAIDWMPAWSPDGTRIAFTSTRDAQGEIYVMSIDGSGVTRLTFNSASDEKPAWSPDGKQIAFASYRDGNWEVYIMNADGSGIMNLTKSSSFDCCPAWSPDGKQIAFASYRDRNWEVYIMNIDGSKLRRLTDNPAHDTEPRWSADGTRIVFVSERDGNSEIYIMSADGLDVTNLTNNPADDCCPAWSPVLSQPSDYIFMLRPSGDNPSQLSGRNPQGQSYELTVKKVNVSVDLSGIPEIYAENAELAVYYYTPATWLECSLLWSIEFREKFYRKPLDALAEQLIALALDFVAENLGLPPVATLGEVIDTLQPWAKCVGKGIAFPITGRDVVLVIGREATIAADYSSYLPDTGYTLRGHGEWSGVVTQQTSSITVPVHLEDNLPIGKIESISPNPAKKRELVCFSGIGSDPDLGDYIRGHEWNSNIDGTLDSARYRVYPGRSISFCTRSLSVGMHTISFRVKNDNGAWSDWATTTLEITQPEPSILDRVIDFIGGLIDSLFGLFRSD